MKSARSWLHGRSALEELALRCCAWHTYHDWSGFFLLWSRVILRVHSHFSLRISRVQLRLHSEAFSFLSACLRVHASDSRSGDLLDRPIPFGEPRHDGHLRHGGGCSHQGDCGFQRRRWCRRAGSLRFVGLEGWFVACDGDLSTWQRSQRTSLADKSRLEVQGARDAAVALVSRPSRRAGKR